MFKISVLPGDEVLETISKDLKQRNIIEGCIVSVIGAVSECRLSTMSKKDAKKDRITTYKEPLELSGTGEIHHGIPHIHTVAGREGNKAVFGHLHYALVHDWFVHVYVIPSSD